MLFEFILNQVIIWTERCFNLSPPDGALHAIIQAISVVSMAITRTCSAAYTFASSLESVPQLLVRSDIPHVEELRKLQHTVSQMFHVRVLPDLTATPTDETLPHVVFVDVINYLLQ